MSKVYTYYYFIGVGGIGMSALARFFNAMGKEVYGYDKTPSPLTDALIQEGIQIGFEDDQTAFPEVLNENKGQTMVVYTPAIPSTSELLALVRSNKYDLFKRSEVLGMITADSINLSVAGTHGKTTTSCMLAAIFKRSDKRFSAFLGGISADLGSNFYHQPKDGPLYTITEADEYDRSFLQLDPSMAIITSTDSDHLDIYGKASAVAESFQAFADKVSNREHLLVAKNKTGGLRAWNYSATDKTADYYAEILRMTPSGTHFSIWKGGDLVVGDVYLNIPGIHNLENAIAAVIMAMKAGVGSDAIRAGLSEFKGIKRRFELLLSSKDYVYIDDYAHHPSELDSIIGSVRQLYPGRKLTGIFQPHLFSRTRDFMAEFARSLEALDELILLPIYPAREEPIEGVNSAVLLEQVQLTEKSLVSRDQLVAGLDLDKLDIVLTLGAGDIDRIVEPLKARLNG